MNPAVIARAVLTRLKADSTLYTAGNWTSALSGGASYVMGNPQGLAYPLLVYGVECNQDNNFTGIECAAELTFNVFCLAETGTDKLETIIDRLIGDAMLSSGSRNAPTYGFHNHTLSLPSIGSTNVQGANSAEWNFQSSSIGPSESTTVIQATVTFSGRVGNQAANV